MPIQRFSNLNFERWDSLRSAIDRLIANDTYDDFVSIHSQGQHRMHSRAGRVGRQRFLPWHRAYLINFERALRDIDRSLSIPYWDWNADEGELREFSDLLGLSSGRDLGARRGEQPSGRMPWFTSETQVDGLLSFPDGYDQFTHELETKPHNDGHRWIGGDMATMNSPRDPAFWFHHAQVDRIWALWQQRYPDEIANLPEREARLDPWGDEFTVRSVNNISDLGYEYV